MNRSTLIISVGVATLVATAGCSTTPTQPNSAAGSAGGSGSLSFLSPWTKDQTEPMVAAYAAAKPDVKINVT